VTRGGGPVLAYRVPPILLLVRHANHSALSRSCPFPPFVPSLHLYLLFVLSISPPLFLLYPPQICHQPVHPLPSPTLPFRVKAEIGGDTPPQSAGPFDFRCMNDDEKRCSVQIPSPARREDELAEVQGTPKHREASAVREPFRPLFEKIAPGGCSKKARFMNGYGCSDYSRHRL